MRRCDTEEEKKIAHCGDDNCDKLSYSIRYDSRCAIHTVVDLPQEAW